MPGVVSPAVVAGGGSGGRVSREREEEAPSDKIQRARRSPLSAVFPSALPGCPLSAAGFLTGRCRVKKVAPPCGPVGEAGREVSKQRSGEWVSRSE